MIFIYPYNKVYTLLDLNAPPRPKWIWRNGACCCDRLYGLIKFNLGNLLCRNILLDLINLPKRDTWTGILSLSHFFFNVNSYSLHASSWAYSGSKKSWSSSNGLIIFRRSWSLLTIFVALRFSMFIPNRPVTGIRYGM